MATTCNFYTFLRVSHFPLYISGPSSLGVPGVPWHTQILADQLTLFQPGGTDYAHLITTGSPGFSDLPTALYLQCRSYFFATAKFLHDAKMYSNGASTPNPYFLYSRNLAIKVLSLHSTLLNILHKDMWNVKVSYEYWVSSTMPLQDLPSTQIYLIFIQVSFSVFLKIYTL